MGQLEHIEAIEKRVWTVANTLRSNSNYTINEYFMPVMELIFLHYAYSHYLLIKKEIEATLPSRGGRVRLLTKQDFSQKNAIFLKPKAQFDYLVSLSDRKNRIQNVINAKSLYIIGEVTRSIFQNMCDRSPPFPRNDSLECLIS